MISKTELKTLLATITVAVSLYAAESQAEPQPVSPSHGTQLPIYDMDAHCKTVAGKDDYSRRRCAVSEQASHNWLKFMWAGLPQKTRAYCRDLSENHGITDPSYIDLQNCVGNAASVREYIDQTEPATTYPN